MAQPVWITPAGSLGNIPEGKFFQLTLEAYDPDDDPLYFELIAGRLPAGMQIAKSGLITGIPQAVVSVEGVPLPVSRDVTSKFATRVYNTKVVNGQVVINRLADRTFTITVNGQNPPQFVTPAGNIATYYDGVLVTGLQIEYTDPDPADVITISLVAGALPTGLSISSTGLISGFIQPLAPIDATAGFSRDGQGFDVYPFDFSTQATSANYQFTLELSDGKSTQLRTFVIFVYARNTMTADNTQITADNTFITADVSPQRPPILLTPAGSIGTVRNDNFFAFQFIGLDLDGDQFRYEWNALLGSSLPPGLTLDPNSGWVYGYIPPLGLTENIYEFAVRVYKVNNPDIISDATDYSLTVLGPINTDITWLVPSNLGSIDNGATSMFYVAAVNRAGIPLQYQLLSGSDSLLPQGLTLLTSGEIAGRVSFNTFALDLGSTTFDKDTTTFDLKYTFTVQAFSVDGLINVSKQFSITVIRRYNEPYENLYIQAMPPQNDRDFVNSLLQNDDIFVPDYIYRFNDPNFGVAKQVVYDHAFGLTAATYADYVSSLYENHYWKNLTLGEVRVAQARNAAGEVVYEAVYSIVIDDLVNAQGESVSKQVVLPYPINAGDSTEISFVYPNSLINMRDQVIDTVGQISNVLPLWMTSKQANGQQLGFVPAWVIAYAKPGRGDQIAYYIRTKFGENLNLIDFEVDRYELDRLLTHNWDPVVPTVTFNPERTGNHLVLSDDKLTVTALSGMTGYPASVQNRAINPGEKVMFSVTIDIWAPVADTTSVGVVNTVYDADSGYIGYDYNGLGLWDDGLVYVNNNSTSGYPVFGYNGAVVDVAVDRDNNLIWFRVAGGDWNNDSAADPAAGTGGIDISEILGILYPAVSPYYASGTGSRISINTTAQYAAPTGFTFIGAEQGSWIPSPPSYTTFDVNAHYQLPVPNDSSFVFDGGLGYAVGNQILILGSQIGGEDGLNDVVVSVQQVDALGTIEQAIAQGTAPLLTVGNTYTNIVGTNITGTGTGATWDLEVVGEDPTVFDGNSLKFTAPVDMYSNTTDYDKYLVFPYRTILG